MTVLSQTPSYSQSKNMHYQFDRTAQFAYSEGLAPLECVIPMSTIFIIDDDPRTGKSLAWLVESVDLKAEVFDSAKAFLDAFDPDQPGCVICDVRMPGMSGIELQERLRTMGSRIPMIMITGYGDVASAVRAMKAGAIDFLEKPVSDQVLLDFVQRAVVQDTASRADTRERMRVGQRLDRLTRREREVMGLVIDGLSSKEIAARLGVSFKTIESHRAKVMRKMQARSVPHLIHMNIKRGEAE